MAPHIIGYDSATSLLHRPYLSGVTSSSFSFFCAAVPRASVSSRFLISRSSSGSSRMVLRWSANSLIHIWGVWASMLSAGVSPSDGGGRRYGRLTLRFLE